MRRHTMPGNGVHKRRVIFKHYFIFYKRFLAKKPLSRRLATGNVKRLTAVGQKGLACVRAYRDRRCGGGGSVYIIISLNRVRVGRVGSAR